MEEGRAIVAYKVGLHARPAAMFVQEARRFSCRVTVEVLGRIADAKSIIQVLTLGARQGQQIVIRAEGDRESEAVQHLIGLVESGLDPSPDGQ